MDYRQLGRSELTVSRIGLGSGTFGREIDEATSFQVMDRALEHGITLFDTAEAYGQGRAEEIIGRWMQARGSRQHIVLATKVTPPLTRQRVIASCEASLRRLQTDHVDLFQLHRFDPAVPQEDTLEALDTLARQGKARAIGCSNHAAWQLCRALWRQDAHGWTRCESAQENYNLTIRDIEQGTLPLCQDQQVGVISYSPLGAGFLTGKYGPDRQIPPGTRFDVVKGHADPYFLDESFRIVAALRAKGEALGIPLVQLALAWVFTQPAITATLVGARSTAQVDQALAAYHLNMTPALREELSRL